VLKKLTYLVIYFEMVCDNYFSNNVGLMSVQTVAEAGTPPSPPAEQLQQKLSFLSSGYCRLPFQQQNS
jgi:hypothetical protein